MKLIFN
jgi:hypothetical protein